MFYTKKGPAKTINCVRILHYSETVRAQQILNWIDSQSLFWQIKCLWHGLRHIWIQFFLKRTWKL